MKTDENGNMLWHDVYDSITGVGTSLKMFEFPDSHYTIITAEYGVRPINWTLNPEILG